MDRCESISDENPLPAKAAEGGEEEAEARKAEKEEEADQTNHLTEKIDKWADQRNFLGENYSEEQFVLDADNVDIGRRAVPTLQISMHSLGVQGRPPVQAFALDSVRPSAVWTMGFLSQIRC